ncbi:efflux RND transporter periplasmic adaptor subunit [Lutibacter sp.]|uniref:efflux RND transporter periplasmic adaptor subunit n=1 Tax=Lutibacter sp. TaxID=1925666 RepID=UPI0025C62CCF|nr:efflux RND transporter periplasmic adaptor subunit [Lutibacter sp.]
MKTYILKSTILLLIIGVISSCDTSKTSEKEIEVVEENNNLIEITSTQFKNSNMELGTISSQLFSEGIKTNGYIDVPPANRAKVTAIMGGYIKKSSLLIGDSVKKGQLLLTMENPDFIQIQQEYLEIYEKLNYLKSENSRQKTLFEEKITSQKNYLKAESDYNSAQAIYNGLEQKLRLMNIDPLNVKQGKITSTISIYAPIAGSVSNVYASLGEFKNSSEVLIEIINDNHKHLELIVFEKDILKVAEGQKIMFNIPESSSKSFNAEVHLVGKSIDENRTVRVHGHLENENEPFLVGMFVEAEIITDSYQKPALPISSLLEEDTNYYVLVLRSKNENSYEFEKVKISIGAKNEEWAEVLNLDVNNKEILIKGAFLPLE